MTQTHELLWVGGPWDGLTIEVTSQTIAAGYVVAPVPVEPKPAPEPEPEPETDPKKPGSLAAARPEPEPGPPPSLALSPDLDAVKVPIFSDWGTHSQEWRYELHWENRTPYPEKGKKGKKKAANPENQWLLDGEPISLSAPPAIVHTHTESSIDHEDDRLILADCVWEGGPHHGAKVGKEEDPDFHITGTKVRTGVCWIECEGLQDLWLVPVLGGIALWNRSARWKNTGKGHAGRHLWQPAQSMVDRLCAERQVG